MVYINSNTTIEHKGNQKLIYEQNKANQTDVNSFIDPNRITPGKTWINRNLQIQASPLS